MTWSLRFRTWLLAIVGTSALVLITLWLFAPPPQGAYIAPPKTAADFDYDAMMRGYDWATSRQNLEMIGRALREYRRQHKPKPVAERQCAADAGVPDTSFKLQRAMSVPPELWFTRGSQFPQAALAAPYGQGFVASTYGFPAFRFQPQKRVWSTFGERMPILVDWNAYTPKALRAAYDSARKLRCLVLRLDGTVELITVRPLDEKDMLNLTQAARDLVGTKEKLE